MYDDNDFFAIAKFLRLGIKITLKNPMGQNSSFSTSFPTPKGSIVSFDEKSLYDLERKLRTLLATDVPVKTKLAPFDYLGTNFRGLIFHLKEVNEFVLQETHDLFGMESKKIVRKSEHFFQLLK
ncbi:hypothetical protein QN372_02150 [Undibacterium sp. RTI2.1]|uniref:hypothetical protein n=1 Tax=unclassified Undibacterium TaxID=2630295 RepID=UPI002AB472EB|nr:MULTISPECIES: hypothetical protein [unclassified Undibacterium]MDY7536794.1 hypothetical protein [Undibacterium sp. 5I1]MEB0029540.1 hypothetical protein [Undibacterium sp. RTI2.1]MEB0115727.1 hypothetical protein [Undibacterium sp. RTI2.2]MEB0231582.1 hypothetical protein [Undibacterium sp. 10I3]MEB0256676.1 hypothetical protein [Undibacterium sp. 5I1]